MFTVQINIGTSTNQFDEISFHRLLYVMEDIWKVTWHMQDYTQYARNHLPHPESTSTAHNSEIRPYSLHIPLKNKGDRVFVCSHCASICTLFPLGHVFVIITFNSQTCGCKTKTIKVSKCQSYSKTAAVEDLSGHMTASQRSSCCFIC